MGPVFHEHRAEAECQRGRSPYGRDAQLHREGRRPLRDEGHLPGQGSWKEGVGNGRVGAYGVGGRASLKRRLTAKGKYQFRVVLAATAKFKASTSNSGQGDVEVVTGTGSTWTQRTWQAGGSPGHRARGFLLLTKKRLGTAFRRVGCLSARLATTTRLPTLTGAGLPANVGVRRAASLPPGTQSPRRGPGRRPLRGTGVRGRPTSAAVKRQSLARDRPWPAYQDGGHGAPPALELHQLRRHDVLACRRGLRRGLRRRRGDVRPVRAGGLGRLRGQGRGRARRVRRRGRLRPPLQRSGRGRSSRRTS